METLGYQQPNGLDFCNASGSTTFQPIKSQFPIPTAHVMPSTLAALSSNAHMQDRALLPTEAAPSIFPTLPTLDPSAADETRKFEMPNIEPTLNQSSLMNTFCSEVKPPFEVPAVATNAMVTQYRALPESKEAGGVERTGRTVFTGATHQGWGLDSFKQHPAGEYSAWRPQQNQYTENLRMNMEKLQHMRNASTRFIHPAALHQNSNEWERVMKTSDGNLLMALERQRQHISQLEQRLRESEMSVHSPLNQNNPYNDICWIRLQELQREVTFLRAQFAEKTETSGREKAKLEKKLCALEAENRKLKETINKTGQQHSDELKKQEERVKGREKHINSLKKKCQKDSEQNKENQQKIESLERYLADLPTVQDQQKLLHQLKEHQEQNCLLQDQFGDLERKLTESRATCREYETMLAAANFKVQEHFNTIQSLQNELEKLETTDWKVEEKRFIQEIEDLRCKVEFHLKEQECLRKVVESQKQKLEQMYNKAKELEEQVDHEEGMGQALKEESQRKDTALQQLKSAVKELAIQNQDLMERNVTLQEQLRLACVKGQPVQMETMQLLKLFKELNCCQKDLRSICTLLSQRMQGSDPNLSMLLGVHSTSVVEDQEELSLESYLNGIDQLKKDIEDLRINISDRYAQDMGDNCITQ
ncbi:centrosomal protein of 85 kDa isoform 2-T2 [Mantella aurantiaca]